MRDLARALVLVRMAGLLEDGVDLVLECRIVVEAVLGRAQLQRASVADRQDGQAHVLGNRDIARIDGERREVIDALRVRGAAARPVRDLLQLDAERFAYLLHGGIGFGCSPLEDTAREKCKFHQNAGRILRPLRPGRNARFTSLSLILDFQPTYDI